MKKILSIFALFLSILPVRAEIHVDVSPGNGIIHVWGDVEISDYIPITNVCANYMGTCTNCVNISPSEMRAYKSTILSECDTVSSNLIGISHSAIQIYSRMFELEQDIQSFQRFLTIPRSGGSTAADRAAFTNYVYSTVNTQTTLDKQNRPVSGATQAAYANQWIAYNNGIYDYANDYVLPQLSATRQDAEDIVAMVDDAQLHIDTIKAVVGSMSEDACDRCSGGDGGGGCDGGSCDSGVVGGSCTNCPCAEQLDAINSYVQHIDDDFHDQLFQMSIVTNFIPRMDSYARLVSGVLYNDSTIVVDDGENSWSNVYRRGYSDLYDYDKSNILQRIELLLFGISYNTSSNWADSVSASVSGLVDDAQQSIDDVIDAVSQSQSDLEGNIRSIRSKIEQLWQNLNFFGAGQLVDFEIIHQFSVFEMYDISAWSRDVDKLDGIRNISRTACQVIYWSVAIVILLLFYYKCVSLTFAWFGGFLKFFNSILS